MAKYKPGDRVRIVDKWVSGWQNPDGKMDKWLGKVMTVRSITAMGDYKMEEDKLEHDGGGWFWTESDIAGLACPFKVGDRVICNSDRYGITKKGWIGTVTKVYEACGEQFIAAKGPGISEKEINFEGLRPEYFDLYAQKIVVTTDGKTTTARLFEGKKCVKTAEAKCSDKDTFSFEAGAVLAVDRLLGREKKKPEESTPVPFDKSMLVNGRFGRVANCRSGNGWFVIVDDRLIYENGNYDNIRDLDTNGAFTAGGYRIRPIECLVDAKSFNNARAALDGKGGGEIIWTRKG